MIDERTEEEASLYALGALDAEALQSFEQRLRSDPQLQALVRELSVVTEAVAGSSEAIAVPAAVKARLLMEITDRPAAGAAILPPKSRSSAFWLPWALAAGLAVLCVAFAWQRVELRTQLEAQARRIEELSTTADLLRSESEGMQQTVQNLRNNNRLANVRIAVLNSLLGGSKAVAVSVWDGQRQSGIFVVHNLKPPPSDKDYQLWVIDKKYPNPVDAGVIRVDADGNVRAEFKARQPIQTADQFAVTLERKGGAPAPTISSMVLAGS